jgi:hypothetical protein
MTRSRDNVELDTSDVDRWVGVPLGGGQLRESVATNDIRRWVQAMHNANPLHYLSEYAEESRFGTIVAPQSFTVATDVGHGATPAIQGTIPGSHMLFGGDEWWFYGPRIYPGDLIRQERMLFDYRVTDTSFAGPTMFSRGDTTYIKDNGEVVGKQRSTSIRYLVEEAHKRQNLDDDRLDPVWSAAQLAEIEAHQLAYFSELVARGHGKRRWSDVEDGDLLPARKIGPHSIQSFTTEWRAFNMTIWGATRHVGVSSTAKAGWLPEMSSDQEKAQLIPSFSDGLYFGASRGHVQPQYAQLIGMPRGYGYGASMGAWVLDYLGNWAGEWGFVEHVKAQYRSPALTGDVTTLEGKVVGKEQGADHRVVRVMFTMMDQNDNVMAKGTAEISLPDD